MSILAIWEMIVQVAPAIAVIIAIVGFTWQVYVNWSQKKYERSHFRLQSALDAFDQAINQLKNENNERVNWVAAARILERGLRISKGITEDVHRDVLEIQIYKYRMKFDDYLGYDNPAITGSFFYGGPKDIYEIEKAAALSTEKVAGRPQIRSIPEKVLKIIWDFTQFPKDYDDPLTLTTKFTDEEINSPFNPIQWPGLFEYLKFQRHNMSIDGEVIPRQEKK